MYQSDFFFLSEQDITEIFQPVVTSAFKILADKTYLHNCDDEERAKHPKNSTAFIRCTEGQGRIYLLNGNKLTLNKNEYVFVSFRDIEKYKSISTVWGYRWVNFYTKDISTEFELNKIYSTPFTENENTAFNKLLAYGQANLLNYNYVNSLFLNYFYSVTLGNQFTEEDTSKNSNAKIIDEMCSFILQKIYSKITIDEIAVFFKISPRRLHQIFTKELNISPKKYILKKKMEEGYRLVVQTTIPINQIADMLCFSSPYHFTNEFKKTFGQSPNEVRKMEQQYQV